MRGIRASLAAAALLPALCMPAAAGAQEAEDALPAGAVARVADRVIAGEAFGRWRRVFERAERTGLLDAPAFRRCVAARLDRRAYRHLDGDRARLRRSCARDHRRAVAEVMPFLVQTAWVEAEAELQGIAVSDERVRRSLERQKRAAFGGEREYRRFLLSSGMTERMVLVRVRASLLQSLLTRRALRSVEPATDPRVRARREQRALELYIAEFRARWSTLTLCAPEYRVRECGG